MTDIKKLKLLATAALLALSGLASASNSSATLTADNEYWLYSGNATGSNLQLIGHGANWPTANSYSFDVTAGDYLYVMALDWGQPHAWQGLFNTPSGTVYTNDASWVAYTTSNTTVNAAVISGATWSSLTTELPATSGPWGNVVGDVNAKWIWNSGIYSGDTAVLFRSATSVDPTSPVPESDTAAMMVAGLAVLGAMVRRRQGKSWRQS
jgi:hypothetical protein